MRRLVAAAVIVAAACGGGGTSPRAAVGSPAPGFDGALAQYKGRPVILTFFASWCFPCKKELPLFLLAEGKHQVKLVGVIFQDDTGQAMAFRNGIGGDWPALEDPGGALATAYGVRGIPRTFFVDRDGILRAQQIGEIDAATLEEKVAKIKA